MPPKKDTGGDANELLAGFANKETKLLAAAYLSSTATDKFDYDLMATLTNNTAGSLKKMWPPVKKKAMENHPSFAKFLGHSGAADVPSSQATPKKRKPSEDVAEEADESEQDQSELDKKTPKAKKSAEKSMAEKKPGRGRGRPRKQLKTEETDNDNASEKAADDAVESDQDKSELEKKPSKYKKPAADKPARVRGHPKKQIKTEEAAADDGNDKVNSENSADGGDGLDDNIETEV